MRFLLCKHRKLCILNQIADWDLIRHINGRHSVTSNSSTMRRKIKPLTFCKKRWSKLRKLLTVGFIQSNASSHCSTTKKYANLFFSSPLQVQQLRISWHFLLCDFADIFSTKSLYKRSLARLTIRRRSFSNS